MNTIGSCLVEETNPVDCREERPLKPAVATASALLLAIAAMPVLAQTAALLYQEADLPLGEKLLREHRCAECHIRRVGGDGTAIYRPKGRINTPVALRGMVETCNLELNLTLFPDEVTSISAVLNRDHYRFK
jgi:hypothetical protein